jgi:hypothetical protein
LNSSWNAGESINSQLLHPWLGSLLTLHPPVHARQPHPTHSMGTCWAAHSHQAEGNYIGATCMWLSASPELSAL